MAAQVDRDVPVHRNNGPKRPDMPHIKATKSVLNLTVLTVWRRDNQVVAASRARARDFQFLSQILGPNSCPEWNGFNSHLNRDDGHTIIPATPLIDMKPSDPDTMLTAMVGEERLVKSTGQDIVVFTCDQQLYKIAVNITWANPERFQNFVLRLGGMHFIMNFIGCVGTLMADTGLSDVMECAFGEEFLICSQENATCLLGDKLSLTYDVNRSVICVATHMNVISCILFNNMYMHRES